MVAGVRTRASTGKAGTVGPSTSGNGKITKAKGFTLGFYIGIGQKITTGCSTSNFTDLTTGRKAAAQDDITACGVLDDVVGNGVAGQLSRSNRVCGDRGGKASCAGSGNCASQSNSLVTSVRTTGVTGVGAAKGAVLGCKGAKAESGALISDGYVVNQCAANCSTGNFFEIARTRGDSADDNVLR